jgi:hypothetical protein
LFFGTIAWNTSGYEFNGYINEIRISKGTDRGWTGETIEKPPFPYGTTGTSSFQPLTPNTDYSVTQKERKPQVGR